MQYLNELKIKLKAIKGTNIGDLIVGSGFNSAAKILAIGLGFIGSILIARYYSADVLGKIATISSMFTLLSLFALLGNHTYILRTIPQKIERFGERVALRVFFKITSLVLISACVVVVVLMTTLNLNSGAFSTAKQFEFLLYGLVLIACVKKLSVKALRALGDYKIFSTFEVLPPFFMMGFVFIAVVLNIKGAYFIYFYYVPHFVLAFMAFCLAVRQFKIKGLSKNQYHNQHKSSTTHQAELPTYFEILTVSVPMLGVTLSNAVITNTDILMLSSFTNDKTVGIYSIYVKLAAIMWVAMSAINSMYAPKAAKLHGAGKIQELKVLTKRSAFLSFSFSCLVLLFISIIHHPVLSLYGTDFLLHTTAFYILLISVLCNSFFGSIGVLLNMTGMQNRFFVIMLTAALLNIALNYILIPKIGPTGAALATLITVIYWNTLALLTVKSEFGFTTFPAIKNR